MAVVVLGPGALGSLLAARLATAGEPVRLLGRPTPHVEAIERAGLTLEELDGRTRTVAVETTTNPAAVAAAEAVIVAVKTWATEEAVSPLAPSLREQTLVLTLQNGLGNRERIARVLTAHPPGSIAAGTTTEGALRLDPGRVRHTGGGETVFGLPLGEPDTRIDRLAASFRRSGMATRVVADVEPWLWRKLATNAAINGLTALAGVANGVVAADPALAGAARMVAREVAAVAAARGVATGDVEQAVLAIAAATAGNRSSMLRDLEAHQPTEVEAIHGAVVAAAAAAGVAAPLCRLLAALIAARERVGRNEGQR